jgi:hypothetical protein
MSGVVYGSEAFGGAGRRLPIDLIGANRELDANMIVARCRWCAGKEEMTMCLLMEVDRGSQGETREESLESDD